MVFDSLSSVKLSYVIGSLSDFAVAVNFCFALYLSDIIISLYILKPDNIGRLYYFPFPE